MTEGEKATHWQWDGGTKNQGNEQTGEEGIKEGKRHSNLQEEDWVRFTFNEEGWLRLGKKDRGEG